MEVIPCQQNHSLKAKIEAFAEVLKTEAHLLGGHDLDERDFYNSGLFRGAIERVRGQFSAATQPKREFVRHVLNYLEDQGAIEGWEPTSASSRHDFEVRGKSGQLTSIALKGCLDGNNTTLFERPDGADRFVIWSLCSNLGADPRRNVWSGISTRLTSEILVRKQIVDGLIVWDMMCGTQGRPCPKLLSDNQRATILGPFRVPPPCIYLFPNSLPSIVSCKIATAQPLSSIEFLEVLHSSFWGRSEELNYVDFELGVVDSQLSRQTTVKRNGIVVISSGMIPIQRGMET